MIITYFPCILTQTLLNQTVPLASDGEIGPSIRNVSDYQISRITNICVEDSELRTEDLHDVTACDFTLKNNTTKTVTFKDGCGTGDIRMSDIMKSIGIDDAQVMVQQL